MIGVAGGLTELLLCRQGCYYVCRVVTVLAGLLLYWQGCYSVGRVVTMLAIFQIHVLRAVPLLAGLILIFRFWVAVI